MLEPCLRWKQTTACRVADYKPFQVLDGEGLRCSLYVSYCPFNCLGCYNKAAQKKDYGTEYTTDLEERILADVATSHVAGLTLLGGEPMLNARWLLSLACGVRELGKTVWCYSGYTFEELQHFTDERAELLELIDVLVDGRYLDHRPSARFRGSDNQRLIDVKASMDVGEVQEYAVG